MRMKLGMSKSIWHVVPTRKMGISKNWWVLDRWKWSKMVFPGSKTNVTKKHRNVEVSFFKEFTKHTHTHTHGFIKHGRCIYHFSGQKEKSHGSIGQKRL